MGVRAEVLGSCQPRGRAMDMDDLAILLTKIQQKNLRKSFSCLTTFRVDSGGRWPPLTPTRVPRAAPACWQGAGHALLLFSQQEVGGGQPLPPAPCGAPACLPA